MTASSPESTSSSPPRRPLPHVWVLYVAALAPTLAIVFAFSLGPSPAKRLARLKDVPVEQARSILAGLDADGLALLVEGIRRPEMPHRALAVRHLGEIRHQSAATTLVDLSRDDAVPEGVRAEALQSLHQIDATSAKRVARSLGDAPSALRSEADRILQGTDRS